jgi:hypothetical protein
MANWLDKYEQGGLVLKKKTKDNYGKKANPNDVQVSVGPDFVGLGYNIKGRNYSPAWGGQFQMGGSMPGAVGFTYARTQNPAPSNGKYAKKTKASAQNGQEMKYYQEGLDFAPKTISKNGSIIKDDMGQWAHPGEITEINSNNITMQGVDYPVLGISDTGDTQMMYPNQNYKYEGSSVIEYPILENTNFTNYNNMAKAKQGKKLTKAAMGKAMVYNQLQQLTDWSNHPIAQFGTQQPFEFNKFGATAKNPEGSFGVGAGQAGLSALGSIGQIVGGIETIGQQKKNIKKAQQSAELSNLALQAQNTMQQPKNQYVRPEDYLVQPGQLGNPYGTGTNYLAEDGIVISGNPTEIQNTYAPANTLYNDLGYEPLEETYKQYRHGGHMHKAEFGEYFQDSGQAQIGSAVGGAIGSAFGPAGQMVGSFLGKIGGNLLGGAKDARALKAQQDQAALAQSQIGFSQARSQGPFKSFMEEGGWVSHDWQPQVITTFGEHKLKDLLQPPHDANMLRAGGHLKEYTPPSAEALYTGRPEMLYAQDGVQMAMGGELQVGDGGYLETMSYNPNLPGGEIGMFRGASHDNGGIMTKYGENEVEVEGGEPAVKLQDGGSSDNLVVFGNMKINKDIANLMGDPKAKGKKFKTYIADVAKDDVKQLKRMNKGLELIEGADENSAFDQLTLNTGQAILNGVKAYQKINANKIQQAGIVQDAIHQTARSLGAKSDKLAEGKIEKETDSRMIAQKGVTKSPYKFDINTIVPKFELKKDQITVPYQKGKEPITLPEYIGLPVTSKKFHPPSIEDMEGPGSSNVGKDKNKDKTLGNIAMAALSNLEPYLRPSNANEPLPPDQLYPEYLALATNQLEPVRAQKFQPMLDTPYDISLNDQLNAIDSQSRAAIRAAGQNPAAQSMIMAQALEAKNKVLGEQTRINQANKMGVYAKNRDLLNQAQLQNLQILDNQYVRQAQAASNTKAQNQAALSSIAAKTAQQRAANRKLAVMENLYNFRFTPSGRAINVNTPQFFNIPEYVGKTSEEINEYMNFLEEQEKEKNKKSTKKINRNGSIVKALKNI